MTGEAAPLTDPLHHVSGPAIAWTRVNIAEGIPGVSTPLNWSHWDDADEYMIRQSYVDMGVLARNDPPPPEDVDHRTSSIFYGRVALNVDLSRGWADRQPGTSGDALEEHYFGSVRPGVQSQNSRRRYPVIFVKTPGLFAVTPRWLRRAYTENEPWWQANTARDVLADGNGARARFVEARARFLRMSRPHTNVALLCGPLFGQLNKITAAAGRPELMMTLLGGHDSIEMETTADLWDVSRERLSIGEFLRRRGFQGPAQGEISSRSWREDPAPIRLLVETFRAIGDESDPRIAEQHRRKLRMDAEREVLAALPRGRRASARGVFMAVHTYFPLREIGKAGLMQMLDVARAAARSIGADLVRRGVLQDPDDVFYLTVPELTATHLPVNVHELVAFRRAKRDEYMRLELPESWVGMVAPLPAETGDAGDDPVVGTGVSPGVAEGPVRVLLDPGSDELEHGEILVCNTTDPSYAAYFLVASACVIDIGGALSHGAIVAREVGIPCVINTRNGTKRLRTGDVVRVDGSSGTVVIVKRGST
jgi:phosphohistidine swiveling domain-containing protein